LAKPRALISQLGVQRKASQRQLSNQMATVRARLITTQKHAKQWAERSDETALLPDGMRRLGEHAALLQVNARIRVGETDAGLADDFHRLNDSVVRVRAQVDALVRRQADASVRTLESLSSSAQALAKTEQLLGKANAQLNAYISGQRDLSGRQDGLDEEQQAHLASIEALIEKLEADQSLMQRVLKAGRADAAPSTAPATQTATRSQTGARKRNLQQVPEVELGGS
ncbi:MAG: hypothetical protein AAF499_10050, partial [Pseudomonadota bacterium]